MILMARVTSRPARIAAPAAPPSLRSSPPPAARAAAPAGPGAPPPTARPVTQQPRPLAPVLGHGHAGVVDRGVAARAGGHDLTGARALFSAPPGRRRAGGPSFGRVGRR